MPSEKKASEGIALLSMYGDEDDEMEDLLDEEETGVREEEIVMYAEQPQTIDAEFVEMRSGGISRLPTPSTHATPLQSSEAFDQPESDTINYSGNGLESAENENSVMDAIGEQENIDPFDTFLPPPPKEKCSEELQEKIIKFLALKKSAGRSFNSEVRNRKEYRNPDFLLHAVTYQNIDQIGSCFSKDVFDPHGYDKSDFYDEIEADMRREMERREQERKKTPKVDFVSGGSQPSNIPTPKISIPTPGLVGGVSNLTSSTSDVTARDGRQNKKSKWDKVDFDQRNSSVTGGQENVGHAATLPSAAKAGSGYSAFAQQKRKDAEEKRSSDRKSERRT